MKPIVDELSAEYKGKISFVFMDVDHNETDDTEREQLTVPYFAIYKDGKQIGHRIGEFSKDALREAIDAEINESMQNGN